MSLFRFHSCHSGGEQLRVHPGRGPGEKRQMSGLPVAGQIFLPPVWLEERVTGPDTEPRLHSPKASLNVSHSQKRGSVTQSMW